MRRPCWQKFKERKSKITRPIAHIENGGENKNEQSRLNVVVLASYFYIAAFYGLGLLFSARSHTSNVAVLKSLFAWVILVLVLPNISPFLAAQVYRIPSAAKIAQEYDRITSEERDEILRQRTREMLQTKFSDLAGMAGMNREQIQEKTQSDPSFKERYAQYAQAWDELVKQVNKEQQEQGQKMRAEFDQRSRYQEKLAAIFASLSPLANFVFIATDITETGMEGERHWSNQRSTYEIALWTYVDAKYHKEKEKNPAFGFNDYLDLRDRPRFQYRPHAIAEKIGLILPQFGVLVFFNLLFSAGAFVSFLRYDVR